MVTEQLRQVYDFPYKPRLSCGEIKICFQLGKSRRRVVEIDFAKCLMREQQEIAAWDGLLTLSQRTNMLNNLEEKESYKWLSMKKN